MMAKGNDKRQECLPIRILDPFQYRAFQETRKAGKHFITAKAVCGKKYLSNTILAEELLEGKRSLVIYQDEAFKKDTQSFFDELQLGSFIAFMDDSFQMEVHELSKTGTGNGLDTSAKEYESQAYKCLLLQNQLWKKYNAKYTPIFENQGLDEIVSSFLKVPATEGSLLLDASIENANFQFEPHEYLQLKEILLQMKEISPPPIPIGSVFDPIQDHWFSANEKEYSKTHFYEKVKALLKEAKSLRKEYLHNIHRYKNLIREQFDKKLSYWNQRVHALKHQIIFTDPSPSNTNHNFKVTPISSFQKLLSQSPDRDELAYLIQNFQEELAKDSHFSKWQIRFDPKESKDHLIALLNQFELEIAAYEFQEAYISDQIKRLGAHSIINSKFIQEQLVHLDTMHKAFIHGLNKEKIFLRERENLAISIPLQMDFLQTQINSLEALVQSSAFYEQYKKWRCLLDELSTDARKIITILYREKVPQPKWVLDEWYLKNIIRKAGASADTNLSRLQDGLKEELRILKVIKAALLQNQLFNARKKIIKKYGGRDKKQLLKMLQSQEPLSHMEAFQELKEKWLDLKPVMAISSSQLVQFSSLVNFDFDNLIVFGKLDDTPEWLPELAKSTNKEIHFQIQDIALENAYPLKMKHGKQILRQNEIHLRNKFEALSEIASFIFHSVNDFTIIKFNGFQIISQLDPVMNKHILAELHQPFTLMPKEARQSENQIFEALIDEGMPVAILSLDLFLQSHKNPIPDWEEYMQTQLKYYGFELFNSWTFDWIRNSNYTAKKIANEIHEIFLLDLTTRKVS